jgi:hypothetical protein
MDGDENQQQLVSNSPEHIAITEETPLTDAQPDETEGIASAIPKFFEWTTSMISEVRIFS